MFKPNTPAGDYWILYLSFSPQDALFEHRIPIAFLPTGEIDLAHTAPDNLTRANDLLAPTVQLIQEILQVTAFDIWRFFNWVFVINYWALLADLGQIAPTAYDVTIPNSPQPVPFPSTNNIFVNATLFQIYSAYFNTTLSPLVQSASGPHPPPVELNDETRLEPIQTTLLRSYTCTWRRIKSPLNLIISVIVADYALIVGAYTVVRLITGWLQRRKDDGTFKRVTI
jgi:hypothetical protein